MKWLEKGVLIVFEGIDGTGKTTQVALLRSHLEQQGYMVEVFCEPTKTGKWGRQIRELFKYGHTDPQREVDLFVKDREDNVSRNILPNLVGGKVVIEDRYYWSNAAYQGALGVPVNAILEQNSFAPRPDITVVIDIPPEQALERIRQKRGELPNQFEELEYLKKVQAIYHRLCADYYPAVQLIDGNQEPQDVFRDIIALVDPLVSEVASKLTIT